jgi:hypothetical protein
MAFYFDFFEVYHLVCLNIALAILYYEYHLRISVKLISVEAFFLNNYVSNTTDATFAETTIFTYPVITADSFHFSNFTPPFTIK